MKIAIHQPNYLPWIGYFDKLDQVDKFVLLDTAIHSKSGFINRNKIKTPQGELWLTVPLKNKEMPINELQIANDLNWQRSHWKAIESNYRKSSFWTSYSEGFERIYNDKWNTISLLNLALIMHINSLLNITTELLIASDFKQNFGSGNTRNMNIVNYLEGTVYISGVGARNYNNETEFTENDIRLIYQDFNHPKYDQRFGKYRSNLSIIDMLFNCGPETMKIIRKQRNSTRKA